MNENEKDRIACSVNALRPDWPVRSVRTLLDNSKLDTRPRRDVAVALTWVACESASKTPARVLEAGPWWVAATAEGSPAPRPPKPSEACATCGRSEDVHDGPWSDHPFAPVAQAAKGRSSDGVAAVREELATTLGGLCSHGVPATMCADHHPAKAETQHPTTPTGGSK